MKRKVHDFVEAKIVSRESLSAYEFISVTKKNPENIKSVSFIPPVIGEDGFGHFDVQYNIAKLVAN